jgi:hypothetical protein
MFRQRVERHSQWCKRFMYFLDAEPTMTQLSGCQVCALSIS